MASSRELGVLVACALLLWALGVAWHFLARVEGVTPNGDFALRDILLLIAAMTPVVASGFLSRWSQPGHELAIASAVAASVLGATLALWLTTLSPWFPASHQPSRWGTLAFVLGPPALSLPAAWFVAVGYRRCISRQSVSSPGA